MYRWGLYHGDELLEAARQIYFDRFQRLLLTNAQTNLVNRARRAARNSRSRAPTTPPPTIR